MARCVHMKWVPVGEVPDHEQSVSEEAPDKALALASAGNQESARVRPKPWWSAEGALSLPTFQPRPEKINLGRVNGGLGR